MSVLKLGQVLITDPKSAAGQLWPMLVGSKCQVTQEWHNVYTDDKGNTSTEEGVDFGTPYHTSVTALVAGTVTAVNKNYGGGGYLTVKSLCLFPDNTWKLAGLYYQHLDLILVEVGQPVNVGDQLGLSGGQLSGGYNPVTNTSYSSGAHIEIGINAPWKYWQPMGDNIDPGPTMLSVISNPMNPVVLSLHGVGNKLNSVMGGGSSGVTANGSFGDMAKRIHARETFYITVKKSNGTRDLNTITNTFTGDSINLGSGGVAGAVGLGNVEAGLYMVGFNLIPFAFRAITVALGIFLFIAAWNKILYDMGGYNALGKILSSTGVPGVSGIGNAMQSSPPAGGGTAGAGTAPDGAAEDGAGAPGGSTAGAGAAPGGAAGTGAGIAPAAAEVVM